MAKSRKSATRSGDLFIEPSGQLRITDTSAEQLAIESRKVECLGMTFESDEARRSYFLEKLRKKLKDPEFRQIEGFPLGEDEDILALSDPPFFTACPNPFAEDFVRRYGRPYDPHEPYDTELFAADVSVGKNHPIYNAHSYHTKVPHRAVARYILHYTNPGDVVLDSFCGSGMTGVAVHACAFPDSEFKAEVEQEMPGSAWGLRHAVLCDLAPSATFIAHAFTMKTSLRDFERAVEQVLAQARKTVGWMFETMDTGSPKKLGRTTSSPAGRMGHTSGVIDYAIWSDVLRCSECSEEVIYWNAALDPEAGAVRDSFPCPSCEAELDKRSAIKVRETFFDPILNRPAVRGKRVPVLLVYSVDNKRYEKEPDADDLARYRRIEETPITGNIPNFKMMFQDPPWGDQWREGYHFDVTHAHHFYTPRNLRACAAIITAIRDVATEKWLRDALMFVFTGMNRSISRLASIAFSYYFKGGGGAINAGTKGTLYISSTVPEVNPLESFSSRARAVASALWQHDTSCLVTTSSCAELRLPDSSVDYIFVDPPFGDSLAYSELNFPWEAWLRVFTAQEAETVVSRYQEKVLSDFQLGMRSAFQELYRVLKPGRWLTVEFHNSQNAVWNAIQEAIGASGFVVADVRVLDKKQGSYNQYVARRSVNKDLVISAYKPNGGLDKSFKLHAGTEEGAWDFIRQHLSHLPVFAEKGGRGEPITERQGFLLFDRMVGFHIQRDISVPLNAAEFYVGLRQRFPEREGMFFLPEQAAEYDRRRLQVKEITQFALFVDDERSAIQWLRMELECEPQSYQLIQPKFLRELHKAKHEHLPELREILQQNFLEDDQGRWYVPDPNKQLDLEKLRERALLREFEEYKIAKQKRLKTFRTEAVRAGFKAAWATRDYQTIVSVAQKLPENILQEDQTILMYYDNASMRIES